MENTKIETPVRTYEQAVEIMVNWWIEKSFDSKNNQDNGPDSIASIMAMGLANMLAESAQSKITEDNRLKFKEKLTELLIIGKREDGLYWGSTLDVDYHPCEKLFKALEYADINKNCVPIKTFTRINELNQVIGRYQYGGNSFTL